MTEAVAVMVVGWGICELDCITVPGNEVMEYHDDFGMCGKLRPCPVG